MIWVVLQCNLKESKLQHRPSWCLFSHVQEKTFKLLGMLQICFHIFRVSLHLHLPWCVLFSPSNKKRWCLLFFFSSWFCYFNTKVKKVWTSFCIFIVVGQISLELNFQVASLFRWLYFLSTCGLSVSKCIMLYLFHFITLHFCIIFESWYFLNE